MLYYAPVWLNELIVGLIKFLINFLSFISFVGTAGLIYSFIKFLIYKRQNNKKLIDFFRNKNILIITGNILLSCAVITLFYLPQQIMPDKYSFDKISIKMSNSSVSTDRITIKDKERLDEFSNILRGHTCRRSLNSNRIILDTDVVFIDLVVFKDKKAFPLHFIVKRNYLERYTAANTDFFM